jgi:hypothetical protein
MALVFHISGFIPWRFIILYLSVPLILLYFHEASAMVTGGNCGDCHTVHNSQNGEPVAYQLSSDLSGFVTDSSPNQMLLISDCVGCHTSTGSSTIVNDVPIIFNTNTYSNTLAGGNFNHIISDDTKGHNVSTIKEQDVNLGLTPPGGTIMDAQLTCAGNFGCHGDRTAGSDEYIVMKGTHHSNDTGGITGGSVGLSYRFLNNILGKEDNDWEQDNINTSHNEYKGSTGSATDTISFLCSECHGDFHTWVGGPSKVGTASPWLRHPTDIALKGSGEYASYTSYNMIVPVARPNPDSVPDTDKVIPGTDIIMCLTCHRAHASPYFKLLRWDYKSSTLATALSGCNVCHTSKD